MGRYLVQLKQSNNYCILVIIPMLIKLFKTMLLFGRHKIIPPKRPTSSGVTLETEELPSSAPVESDKPIIINYQIILNKTNKKSYHGGTVKNTCKTKIWGLSVCKN